MIVKRRKFLTKGTASQAAEKFGTGQEKTYPFDKLRAGSQGLKPDVVSIIYGPTKVVP